LILAGVPVPPKQSFLFLCVELFVHTCGNHLVCTALIRQQLAFVIETKVRKDCNLDPAAYGFKRSINN